MPTPTSSSVPFCDPARFQRMFDVRQLGDLTADAGARETGATLTADQVLTDVLMDATGEVESWVMAANKYNVASLQSLTGASKKLLERITGALAWWYLYDRRHMGGKPMPTQTQWAYSKLEMLHSGQNCLGLQEQLDAGNPSDAYMTESDWFSLNLATDQARRFFGRRAKHNVPGGSGGGLGGSSQCDGDC